MSANEKKKKKKGVIKKQFSSVIYCLEEAMY